MPGLDVNPTGVVARALPAPVIQDGQIIPGPRFGRYREQCVVPYAIDGKIFADEGQYFVGMTQTPGTGRSFGGAARTSFLDTDGGLALLNTDAVGGKLIYLDYIKLITVTVLAGPGTTPFQQFVAKLDAVLSRYASGATESPTPVNVNGNSSAKSISQVQFGPLTFAAASNAARLVGRAAGRGAIGQIDDEILFTFGDVEKATAGTTFGLATAGQIRLHMPPVLLAPNNVFTLHNWSPGQSAAPVYELEMGWWER